MLVYAGKNPRCNIQRLTIMEKFLFASHIPIRFFTVHDKDSTAETVEVSSEMEKLGKID